MSHADVGMMIRHRHFEYLAGISGNTRTHSSMRAIEILSAAVEDISCGKANVDGRLLPEYCYVDE